jgi:hypothetical protein
MQPAPLRNGRTFLDWEFLKQCHPVGLYKLNAVGPFARESACLVSTLEPMK